MNDLPISETFLQQLESLHTIVKNNVAGRFGGVHQTRTFGASCDFADYREYIPGDDIKKIDWNAFARFDRLYVKLYLDEKQMHTRIYLDASKSMGYGEKFKQAIRLCAALAYLSICDMDKVSVYLLRGGEAEEFISAMLGKDKFYEEIVRLNDVFLNGDCRISEAILPIPVGYGDGMSLFISDFLTDDNYEDAIEYVMSKRRDVFCLQVLSREELHPQTRGKVHFFDAENSAKTYRKNINREIIKAYQQALQYATERLENFCLSRGAEYLLIPADQSLHEVFFGTLAEKGVLK